jgi:hypothetical protein
MVCLRLARKGGKMAVTGLCPVVDSDVDQLRCKCESCGRDVRQHLDVALVLYGWRRVKGKSTGRQKARIAFFRLYCSRFCAHRQRGLYARVSPDLLEAQPLSWWTGASAFNEYEALCARYNLDKGLHDRLPDLLYSLSRPVAVPLPAVEFGGLRKTVVIHLHDEDNVDLDTFSRLVG